MWQPENHGIFLTPGNCKFRVHIGFRWFENHLFSQDIDFQRFRTDSHPQEKNQVPTDQEHPSSPRRNQTQRAGEVDRHLGRPSQGAELMEKVKIFFSPYDTICINHKSVLVANK